MNSADRTKNAAWWPPKVGDKLRYQMKFDDVRLLHVVSVFEHQGETRIVGGFYGKHKQWWHYEVFDRLRAEYAFIWPDGQKRPEPT